ncbi:MAG: hypothetical protein V4603_02930 [Pseudomonadota bacterium]
MKLRSAFAFFATALVAAVLLVQQATAQQITETRQLIPATRYGVTGTTFASFAIGLVRPQDLAFRSSAYTGDTISVSGAVLPENAHIGKTADVFAVIKAGPTFYMLNTSRQLVPWNGAVATLVPMVKDVVLKGDQEFSLYSGLINIAGDFAFFMGYKPQDTGALYYNATPQMLHIDPAPQPVAQCLSYGGRTVPVWHTSATGIFTHAPFNAEDLSMITNGKETNDPRFSYQWVKKQGERVNIFAPADGVLIRLRHKARNLPEFDSDDYELLFLVACDPNKPDSQSIVRFNHITNPRADIKAAFAFGELGAPTFKPVFEEHEERQIPITNIVVRAGDYLGSTSGTPVARDFDFSISINEATVCPFSVLAEPYRTKLLAMLGPQINTPFGPPVAGYACEGYGMRQ